MEYLQAFRLSCLRSVSYTHLYYTGRILSVMDMETFGTYVSVDYYGLPRNKAEEYRLHFPEYSKYVSREFDSREDILKDKDITDMKCVKCSRMLRKKLRWFPYGQRFYFCLAVCPEHGYVKGKIRVKKSEDDRFYACLLYTSSYNIFKRYLMNFLL